jgi:hypothetical protein
MGVGLFHRSRYESSQELGLVIDTVAQPPSPMQSRCVVLLGAVRTCALCRACRRTLVGTHACRAIATVVRALSLHYRGFIPMRLVKLGLGQSGKIVFIW